MMPYRLTERSTKIQFLTSAQMPSLIYQACLATGLPSNTVYIQRAVCAALAADLDIPLPTLLAALPPTRGATRLNQPQRVGPGNTVEDA
jgi:hypothetical protein